MQRNERRKFTKNQRRVQRFARTRAAVRSDAKRNLTAGSSPQEQPAKSSSAAIVVAPAVTFSGMAVASLLVV